VINMAFNYIQHGCISIYTCVSTSKLTVLVKQRRPKVPHLGQG
jgi:hypothetical protein